MAAAASVPFFKWAQDADHLFVTIDVPNLTEEKVDLTETSFSLVAKSGKDSFELKFDFSKSIDVSGSKFAKHRLLEFLITKADSAKGFWPHLLKEKEKFKAKCKIDFDKWIDEDDQASLKDKIGDAGRFNAFGGGGGGGGGEDDDMGGMGMGGMPPGMMGGMPGMPPGMMGGMPGMPPGMGGMPGMGGGADTAKLMKMLAEMKEKGGMPGMGGDGPDSDDEDIPDLKPADETEKANMDEADDEEAAEEEEEEEEH